MKRKNFILGMNGHPLSSIPYNANSSTVPGITAQDQVDRMVELGISWYRIDVHTNNNGEANADAAFRSVIRRCNESGINVLPVFYDNSEAFQASNDAHGAYRNAYTKMRGVAEKYGDLFTHCELGNKWELIRGLLNGRGSGQLSDHYHMSRLAICLDYLRGMEDGLKSVRPAMKTIFNTSGFFPLYWATQVFSIVPTINICGWHWYADMPGAAQAAFGWEDVLPEIFKEFQRPIWITKSNSKWSASKSEEENEQDQVLWFNKFSRDCKDYPHCHAYFIDELLDNMPPKGHPSGTEVEKHFGVYKFNGINLDVAQPDYRGTITEKSLVTRLKGEKDFIFGINGHPVNTIPYNGNSSMVRGVTIDRQIELMLELGVQWYRIDVQTHDNGQATSHQAFLSVISKCSAAGIKVLPCFYDRSETFQSSHDLNGAYRHGFNKMAGVAERYGHLFSHCELGNEWELFRNLLVRGELGTRADHYNLTRLAICREYAKGMEEGLKSVRPDIKTIFNTAGFYPTYWAHEVFNAAPTIDICGWHWYDEMPNAARHRFGWEDVLPELYKEFGRPIWITESNSRWVSSHSEEKNNQEQVKWFNRFFRDCLEFPQCEAYFIHELLNNVPPNRFSFYADGLESYRGICISGDDQELEQSFFTHEREINYGIYKFEGIDLDEEQPKYNDTLTEKPSAAHLIAISYRDIIDEYQHDEDENANLK